MKAKLLGIGSQRRSGDEAMKFYLESAEHFKSYRRAHIVNDENKVKPGCLCRATINPEKWRVVESLPEDIYLCRTCRRLAGLLNK